MQVKLSRLCILVQQGCRQIPTMKSEIKYIQCLEAKRENQVCILKNIHDQKQVYRREIIVRQKVLKAPIEVPNNSEKEKTYPFKGQETRGTGFKPPYFNVSFKSGSADLF